MKARARWRRSRAGIIVVATLLTAATLVGCGSSRDDVVSIAVLGDTQMMTEPAPTALAGKFADETTWLQTHAPDLKLSFTIQLGDLTNGTFKSGGFTHPATNGLGLTEMAYAKQAMDKLWLPAGGAAVPWTVSLGNHDIDQWCWGNLVSTAVVSNDPRCARQGGGVIVDGGGTTRTTSNFVEEFPRNYFTAMPTWGGSRTQTDVNDNFHRFRVGAQTWLVVALMWAPQQGDFDWANTVIDREVARDPGVRVVVATHGFMDPAWSGDPTTLPSGVANGNARELYDQVLRLHPEIRLVLGGHWATPRVPAPGKQCLDPSTPTTFEACSWVRRRTVPVPAEGSRPAFTFHALLTDYSNNGDATRQEFQVSADEDRSSFDTVNRHTTDNAFFRLLTFDGSRKTIRVRTITSPTNVAPSSPLPDGCARVSLRAFDLPPVCGKTDAAYGTEQDDYTLRYK